MRASIRHKEMGLPKTAALTLQPPPWNAIPDQAAAASSHSTPACHAQGFHHTTSAPRAIFISALCALLLKTIFHVFTTCPSQGRNKEQEVPFSNVLQNNFPFPNYEDWFPLTTVFLGAAPLCIQAA